MMQPTPVAAPAIDLEQQQQMSSAEEIRTLWIGNLQDWMDETYLQNCFASTQALLSVKIIRNYGFLEFATHGAAQTALLNYNGLQMPGSAHLYRLNWAAFGNGEKPPEDCRIFVGDLASDVTDYFLQETFRAVYPSVKGANVVTDITTGRSKGYGFVRFGDENEQVRAMTEMNGQYCSSRPMRIGPVTRKNATGYQQPYPKLVASYDDPNNTTLFVGGLDATVTEEMLVQSFGQFGELVHVKIPVGKGCGFVQFSNRASAQGALQTLHGTVLGQQAIRLSWGRKLANKEVHPAGYQQPYPQLVASDDDPNNTTVFVGGLDPTVTEEMLVQSFGPFGELVHVKIPVGKRCGFVQFRSRACAEGALQRMQGTVLGQQAIRLSWGGSPANKQVQPAEWVQTQQPDPNQWNGVYYGDGQGYNAGYGFAPQPQPQPQPQDPNMYSYAQYPNENPPNMYSYAQYPNENPNPHGNYQQL